MLKWSRSFSQIKFVFGKNSNHILTILGWACTDWVLFLCLLVQSFENAIFHSFGKSFGSVDLLFNYSEHSILKYSNRLSIFGGCFLPIFQFNDKTFPRFMGHTAATIARPSVWPMGTPLDLLWCSNCVIKSYESPQITIINNNKLWFNERK